MTKEKPIVTASDVANYVVCPEAWRLKFIGAGKKKLTPRESEGQKLRQQWMEKQALSAQLRRYMKIGYALLVAVVVVIFLLDKRLISKEHRTRVIKTPPATVTLSPKQR